MQFKPPLRPRTVTEDVRLTKSFREFSQAEKTELIECAQARHRYDRLQEDLESPADLEEAPPRPRRLKARRDYYQDRLADGTLSDGTGKFELGPPPSVLWFDADIAKRCGSIRAAIFVKAIELQIRSKIEAYGIAQPERLYFWEARENIAKHLSMSPGQLRRARALAEDKGISRAEKRHTNPLNQTRFYSINPRKKFFQERKRAKAWKVRADELACHGPCAAWLELYRVQITGNILEDLKNGNVKAQTEDMDALPRRGYDRTGVYWRDDRMADLAKIFAGLFNQRQIARTVNHLVDQGKLLSRPQASLDRISGRHWFAFPVEQQEALERSAWERIEAEKAAQERGSEAQNGLETGAFTGLPKTADGMAKNDQWDDQKRPMSTSSTSYKEAGRDLACARTLPASSGHLVHFKPQPGEASQEGCPAAASTPASPVFSRLRSLTGQESEDLEDLPANFSQAVEPEVSQELDREDNDLDVSTIVAARNSFLEGQSVMDMKRIINRKAFADHPGSIYMDSEKRKALIDREKELEAQADPDGKLEQARKAFMPRSGEALQRKFERDTPGNVQNIFREVFEQVYPGKPCGKIGSKNTIIEIAHRLGLNVREYCLAAMIQHRTTSLEPFNAGMLRFKEIRNRVGSLTRTIGNRYGTIDEPRLAIALNVPLKDHRIDLSAWESVQEAFLNELVHAGAFNADQMEAADKSALVGFCADTSLEMVPFLVEIFQAISVERGEISLEYFCDNYNSLRDSLSEEAWAKVEKLKPKQEFMPGDPGSENTGEPNNCIAPGIQH